MNLVNIESQIQDCKKCLGLTKLTSNTISFGKNNDILFIGESPAKKGWITTGKAFYNKDNKLLPTARVLNELLKIINLTIDDITFTEACKCYIPDRKLLKNASENCLNFLEKQIYYLNPQIVITLGAYPTSILLDEKFNKYGDIVGKIFKKNILNKEIIIIPIYHPSPINPKSYKGNIPIFKNIKKQLNKIK